MPDIFFDGNKLPNPHNSYVAFVDIMGTRSRMANNVKESANFIFKLHAAVIAALRQKSFSGVFVYPVMDGVYITAVKKEDMESIIFKLYNNLASLFLREQNQYFRFVIRGSIAYGKIINGHNVPYDASKVFEKSLGYKDNILLGDAMIKAYDGEGCSAPFGVYIDESARMRTGSFKADWKWYSFDNKLGFDIGALRENLVSYFEQFRDEHNPLRYPNEKIDQHIDKVRQYFDIVEPMREEATP